MALALCGLLASTVTFAQRPDEGGIWAFAPDDTLERFDSEDQRVRVHYASAGPSVTRLEDLDRSGVPDYVEAVAEVALEALELYEQLGFRPPVAEATLGLGPLGGSEALDIYLVDFQGSADGLFSPDACTAAPRHCAGWLAIENDFFGYGYASLDEALDTVVVHELFHAVQAGYDGEQPVWFSEGTAVWAQRVFWPESPDFVAKADAYLALADRPLDKPPAGPVQSFAYGTALFWWHLYTRHGAALAVELQLASESPDGAAVDLVGGIAEALDAADDSLAEAWFDFVGRNLATGPRAGSGPSYEFGAELDGVIARREGSQIDDGGARFAPLAALYYRLDHAGGPLAAGVDAVYEQLRFSLYRVVDGSADGPVGPALIEWRADVTGSIELGDREAGGYWVVGSLPVMSNETAKVRLCLGQQAFVDACFGDTGASDGDDAAGEPETETDGGGETGAGSELGAGSEAGSGDACACSTAGSGTGGGGGTLGWLVLALARRRSRARARRRPRCGP